MQWHAPILNIYICVRGFLTLKENRSYSVNAYTYFEYLHRGYVNNQVVSVSTGEHFNLPGHSLANMKITIIEQVKKNDNMYRKERKKYFINKFNSYYQGLTREK